MTLETTTTTTTNPTDDKVKSLSKSYSSSWKRSRDIFDNGNDGTSIFIPVLVEEQEQAEADVDTSSKVKEEKSTLQGQGSSNPEYYFSLKDASVQRRRRMRMVQLGISNNDAIQLAPSPQIRQVGVDDTSSRSSSSSHRNIDGTKSLSLQNTITVGISTQQPVSTNIMSTNSTAVSLLRSPTVENGTGGGYSNNKTGGILVTPSDTTSRTGGVLMQGNNSGSSSTVPTPQWHSPWKLSTVLSSHLGWVRCIGFAPDNTMFATGSADRTIKIWNLPKASVGSTDALQLTLTGHISPVRGVVFSPRHPYLFSCGEDKTVKCWDLETNQVIRHYHGHLSGVYAIALHPILDILVTAGRDAVARVWDIRTKRQIHLLSGHDHTVSAVICKSTHPQIITSSHDCTIKLWDLAAGRCFTTLTHHNKAIRSLAMPTFENTFISGATDYIKKWQGKDGKFLHNLAPLQQVRDKGKTSTKFTATRDVICHTVSVNDDGIVVSGYDDGTIQLYDYKTGYNYQTINSIVQPGSLQQAENAVLTTAFDLTGSRLISGEADKSIKIYKQVPTAPPTAHDDNDNDTMSTTNTNMYASEYTHPINMKAWRKQYLASLKERY